MKILTVTLNPSIDNILSIDHIKLRSKNILSSCHTYYGGKGINTGFALGKLGIPALATGLVSEDEISNYSIKLNRVGVQADFYPVKGATRQAFKLMEASSGKDTEFNQSGKPISIKELDDFLEKFEHLLEPDDWVALCGSVPAGISSDIYARLIRLCKSKKINTLLDTSGAPLKEGVKAIPTFLKINSTELNELVPGTGDQIENILQSIKTLSNSGITYVVITLGSEGSLGYDGNEFLKVRIPSVQIKGLTGAGDAMTAGILAAFFNESTFKNALKFGAGLATASTQKLEPGDFDHDQLDIMISQTIVEEVYPD